jgi:trehalose 6-phosphate synthase/phosphatase
MSRTIIVSNFLPTKVQRTADGLTFQPSEGGLATGLFQEGLRAEWKRDIRPILKQYVSRTPGAVIEEKDYSLGWHYRRADVGLGAARTRDLFNHLTFRMSNTDLRELKGNKALEIRNVGINKASYWAACCRRN